METAAGIYARISSDRDGDQLGVRRQVADCEALAARRGWPVAEVYVDDDVSAYGGHLRPEYRRMLTDIEVGRLDAVVVWHLDRLHRRPKELEEFFEVVDKAGVKDLASVTGDVDLATHDGRFMARILGAVASKESDDKSRRLRRKHVELAERGRISGGGTRPFGYESDRRTVRETEAAVIRDLAARVLAGESIRSACTDLNARGVATVTGRPWTPTVLRSILMSGRISGRREHRGEIVADAEWPAIICGQQSDRLRALLGDPDRRANREPRRYLLTGLLRCELCGEKLVARPRADGRRRYICAKGPSFSGCGRLGIVADETEQLIVDGVIFVLDSPELARTLHARADEGDDARLYEEIRCSEAQLEELAAAYAERAISLKEWLAARKPIEARVTGARSQLSRQRGVTALEPWIGKGRDLRAQWERTPLSRQRALVAALLDHAEVGPGIRGLNRFDPTRINPTWRA